jgi:hypothetical protein
VAQQLRERMDKWEVIQTMYTHMSKCKNYFLKKVHFRGKKKKENTTLLDLKMDKVALSQGMGECTASRSQ